MPKSLWVMVVKEELRCPWCGSNFEDTKELDMHARNHYVKDFIA
jgi:uncharacterized C2H2 Zn-finger protein